VELGHHQTAGSAKWTYFYLYVILDVFSRYITGWMVSHRESAELAKQFLEEIIRKHQVPAGQLNITPIATGS
jgi:transposase InsO family protein